MDDRSYTTESRTEAGRFGRYLSTRSAETWMFFAVGIVIGGLFF